MILAESVRTHTGGSTTTSNWKKFLTFSIIIDDSIPYILTVIFSIFLSTLATAAYADAARYYDNGYDEGTSDSCNAKEPHLLVEFCSGNKEIYIHKVRKS